MKEKVVILGASPHADRYAHKALIRLLDYGHDPILVNPNYPQIEGHNVFAHLRDVNTKVDTVTVYINPSHSKALLPEFLKVKPKRVIFNPGSENHELEAELTKAGIHVENACTLVLLSTGQF